MNLAGLDVTVKCPFDTAYLLLETFDKGVAFSLSLAFVEPPGFEELRRCREVVAVIWEKVDYLDWSLRKVKMPLWKKCTSVLMPLPFGSPL